MIDTRCHITVFTEFLLCSSCETAVSCLCSGSFSFSFPLSSPDYLPTELRFKEGLMREMVQPCSKLTLKLDESFIRGNKGKGPVRGELRDNHRAKELGQRGWLDDDCEGKRDVCLVCS